MTHDNRVIESIKGFQAQLVDKRWLNPTPSEFIHPQERDVAILSHSLAVYAQHFSVQAPVFLLQSIRQLGALSTEKRHALEQPYLVEAVQQLLRQHDQSQIPFGIERDPQGIPGVHLAGREKAHIALSHDEGLLLISAGFAAQGCDVEPVKPRETGLWRAILGNRAFTLVNALTVQGLTVDEAGTLVWSAIESIKKASHASTIATGLTVEAVFGHAVLFHFKSAHQAFQILAFVSQLSRPPKRVFAFIVQGSQAGDIPCPQSMGLAYQASPERPWTTRDPGGFHRRPVFDSETTVGTEIDTALFSGTRKGPQGQPMYVHRFRPTFKAFNKPDGSLSPVTLAFWMGEMRELPLEPIAKQLLNDFASGQWAMVTNRAHISLLQGINALDLIEGRIWATEIGGRQQSTLQMRFEWYQVCSKKKIKSLPRRLSAPVGWRSPALARLN